MYQYTSSKTVESQFAPGVVYTLRKQTERRRAERELSFAPLREKFVALTEKYEALRAEADKLKELVLASHEMSLFVFKEWYPAWIRWGIAKIEGLEIDGAVADVERLIEEGPDELIQEAVKVAESGGLSLDEQKNSASPGGSADQAGGTTPTSTAETASSKGSTPAETAASTSPTT